MRSRYTAFALGRIDYLMASHAPRTRAAVSRRELQDWAAETDFVGLQILETQGGQRADSVGVVAFVARLRVDGAETAMVERSRFERAGGLWVYVDGDAVG